MIQYTIEKKTVMTGANPGEIKYYPKIVRATTMTTEKIAALLEERTTISKGEAYAFLQAMAKGITFYVKEAFVVEAEGLGVFSPYIQAKAVDTLEEATEKTIKKKGVRYRPTKAMETKLNQIRFQKANLDSKHL
ncbi:MAG: HU family DNA-binding protein [Bacteroidales bacterium]|nr:HU family DNA-binding protein [Bacteroidales bacterium]